MATEFEFAVWRFSAAFVRWQGDCMSCATASGLSGQDAAILHLIRMRDTADIQYSLRKLLIAGLIGKAASASTDRRLRSGQPDGGNVSIAE